ncbi:MAG: efflux RND transporter periplasmic adaptor subunit [Deltaproteobacteria bacterium]|nr:efflux RND transporter periplasmic adaptor subunit [Deltaproteobacteria bacterium]TLN03926.1 MAG: efflux RND transporter periplasmic adaptor subunit [bacterium]
MNTFKANIKYLGIFLAMLAIFSGCSKEEQVPDKDEPVRVTAYSAKSELFMEYDQPVAGEKTGFLIHLTRLADFKPVTEGGLKLIFTPSAGSPVTFTMPAPTRAGIYKAEVALGNPGKYSLKLVTDGKGFGDEITVSEVRVLNKGEKPAEHKGGDGAIAFLKEQQWVVDFMVTQPVRKDLGSFVTATGELVPVSNAEATVAAPLSGIISTARQLPFIGKKVAKGEIVALIDPPVIPEGGIGQLSAAYAEAKNRVALAQKEYDRARRLHDAKIAPLKRVEEAELTLSSARAALAPLDKAMGSVGGARSGRIAVRAPVSGTVVEVVAGAGKGVEAGQPILRIVNTGTLWLKANIPASEIGVAGKSLNATFTASGLTDEFKPSRLVSIGDMLDPQTRTLPVLFEVPNQSGRLKVGLFANVAIQTGSVAGALAVPKDALTEDEGRWFVFIQSSGEAFDRREVKIGVEDAGFVQIIDGLKGEERVVTRGAYYVKQAESAAKGGADQGHAH